MSRFFHVTERECQIKQEVRESCVFARHDIAKDPPFSRMDLISFRNVLIYMDQVLQQQVIPTLHYAPEPWGFLLLGSSETVGGFSDMMTVVDSKHKIYGKKQIAEGRRLNLDYRRPKEETGVKARKEPLAEERHMAFDLQKEANFLVLNRYAPAGVLINSDLEVVQFRGQTGRFLEHAPGKASFDLLDMARDGLDREVRCAVEEAGKKGAPVTRRGIGVRQGQEIFSVKLDVHPLKPPAGESYFQVPFSEEVEGSGSPASEQPDPVTKNLPRCAEKDRERDCRGSAQTRT